MSDTRVDVMIKQIELAIGDDEIDLTDWETEFIESIKEQETLSSRQEAVLDRIWRKATE